MRMEVYAMVSPLSHTTSMLRNGRSDLGKHHRSVYLQWGKSNAGWVELVGGLTTKVYKNFYMGLSVRYRVRTSMKKTGNTEPWYIPGFGKNKANHFTIGTYSLIYKLPF